MRGETEKKLDTHWLAGEPQDRSAGELGASPRT